MVQLSRAERLLLAKQKAAERKEKAKNDEGVENVVVIEEQLLSRPLNNKVNTVEKAAAKTQKVIFRPSSERKTLEEREKRRQEEEERELKERQKIEAIKMDSKNMLVDLVQIDAVSQIPEEKKHADIRDFPDDTDHNTDIEYEEWVEREISRIIRDIKEREDVLAEIVDTERRRNLTDAERERERALIEASMPARGKGEFNYQYLQKWYHQGAFFQDEAETNPDSIYLRDFSQPTEADLVNKSSLPKPMQLRRGQFGMKGATKYTHLKDQDTTATDAFRYPLILPKRNLEVFSRDDLKKKKM